MLRKYSCRSGKRYSYQELKEDFGFGIYWDCVQIPVTWQRLIITLCFLISKMGIIIKIIIAANICGMPTM